MPTKIDYTGVTCMPSGDKSIRFVLKKDGDNPLFVIGLNASFADENDPDLTVSNALEIATSKGFDGFVMFNLYPLREPKPINLPITDDLQLVEQNVAAIQNELCKVAKPTILASWGMVIEYRKYLGECLQKIVLLPAAQEATWYHFGELTKDGHPRHLSRIWAEVKGDANLSAFDIAKYIENIGVT
jgi:hypothetical protein